jgi:hypothetical protein
LVDPAPSKAGTYLEQVGSVMALPFDVSPSSRDSRAVGILAKTIFRELRSSGYEEADVMALATELLGIVASEMRTKRDGKLDGE